MMEEALETTGDLSVPFAPIVPARLGANFMVEMVRLELSCKSPIRIQQRLTFSGGQIDMRSLFRVGRLERSGMKRNVRITAPGAIYSAVIACIRQPAAEKASMRPCETQSAVSSGITILQLDRIRSAQSFASANPRRYVRPSVESLTLVLSSCPPPCSRSTSR